MSISSNNRNAAKETGGNLETAVRMLRVMEQLVEMTTEVRALLFTLNLQMTLITGRAIDAADVQEPRNSAQLN